jgi:hypothetical protein
MGATTAVGLFTPAGAEVVRLGSALLQAASASDTPAKTSRFEVLMRSPGKRWVRRNAHRSVSGRKVIQVLRQP